jgi:hypothetical protein
VGTPGTPAGILPGPWCAPISHPHDILDVLDILLVQRLGVIDIFAILIYSLYQKKDFEWLSLTTLYPILAKQENGYP